MSLVGHYLSGHANKEQVEELEKAMLDDPKLRSEFLCHARIDAALPSLLAPDNPLATNLAKPQSNQSLKSWMPLAATIILGFFLVILLWDRRKHDQAAEKVAEFGSLNDCRWMKSNSRFTKGSKILSGQRIELASGTAELVFQSGANVVIKGPTILEARTSNSGFLVLGNADILAETPQSKGFTLETPSSTFIDISTAFTATVAPDGLSRLQVSSGAVDVIVNEGDKAQRLDTGEMLYVEPGDHKIVTRIEPGCGTTAFSFPSIAPPSASDYADKANGYARIKGLSVQPHPNSGGFSSLIDGKAQTHPDSPKESYFTSASQPTPLLIDLGKSIDIREINTYSWHQHQKIKGHRNRAHQRFVVYGYSGEVAPELPVAKYSNNWQRIARVNSDRFFQVTERLNRPPQQATSITSPSGHLGHFRYILIISHPSTFFGEIDIHQAP